MEVKDPAVKYTVLKGMNSADFIEWESTQQNKHEYLGGTVIAMAGASITHNAILSNIIGKIHPLLKDKKCNIYPSDLRVSAKSKASFFYPDATIICGDIEYEDDYKNTIKNPAVVFEILSPSTEDYDLGRKFFIYMQIESLKEVIAVDSTKMIVRLGRRKNDNLWEFKEYTKPEDEFDITPIQQTIKLQELYSGIEFPQQTE